MSLYKVLGALALLALGVAVGLGLPSLSPDVEAGLSQPAVKSDRLTTPESITPEPVGLEQAKPEGKPEQVKPEQATLEPIEPTPLPPRRPAVKQAKSKQAEPRPVARAKGCADNTWSYYEVKCQKTRSKVVNGVRTTRIVPADPQPTE